MAGDAQFAQQAAAPAAPTAGKDSLWFNTVDRLRAIVATILGGQSAPVDYDISDQAKCRNLVYNGGFDLTSRVLANIGNNTYCFDRWVQLTNGAAGDVTASQVAGPAAPIASKNAIKLLQSNGAAKNVGLIQWLPAVDSIPLRGRYVTFSINNITAQNIRLAIISWVGTADTLGAARDPVNAWANSADANPSTTFLKSTTQTIDAYIAPTNATGQITVTAKINASANNIGLLIWNSTTLAQNQFLSFSQAMLVDGAIARDWWSEGLSEERNRCQDFFLSTFPANTAPAQGNGVNTGEFHFPATKAGANTNYSPKYVFPRRMRAAPSVTFYNPAAANSHVRDETGGTDCTAEAAVQATDSGITVSLTANAGTAVANLLGVHFTADAEL